MDAERLTAQSVLNTAQPNDPVDGVTTPRVAGAMQSSLHEGRVHRRNSLHRRLSGIGLQELMGQQGGGVAPQQAALNDMQQRINQLQAVLDHTSRAKDHFQSKAAQEADRNRKLSSKNDVRMNGTVLLSLFPPASFRRVPPQIVRRAHPHAAFLVYPVSCAPFATATRTIRKAAATATAATNGGRGG